MIELSDDTLALRCVAGGLQELAQVYRSDHVPAPDRTAAELDRYARRLAGLIPDPSAAATRSVRHFGADEQLTREQLVPGTSARRYTEPAAGGHLELRMPCCERPARVRHGVDHARALIGCPYCHLFYDATVIDELDGGFAVLLEVRTEEFVMARPHRPRRRPQ